MIIDFHTHIMPPHIIQNRAEYARTDKGFADIFSDSKAKLVTAEELISSMDKNEVDVSVVLNYGWSAESLCVEVNDYILESIVRYPKRLVGFCSVAPIEGEKAIRELERCVKGGVKGIGELRLDTQLPPDGWSEIMKPMSDFAIKNNLVMLVHSSEPVGHQYSGKGKVTSDMLYTLASTYPDLKLVCAHWGGGLPFYALMPEVKTALKNVYFDTAASPFLYSSQIYTGVAQIVGGDKILFGSDYPLISPGRYFKEIEGIKLPAATKEKILGGNAQKLLGLVK